MAYPEPAVVSSAVVANAAAGDHAAFTQLVATYHQDMLRLCMVITSDQDLANDAAQAAWHRAWRNLHQLRDVGRVRPWLLTIAANEARQAFRRRRHIVGVTTDALEDPTAEVDRIGLIDLANALARLSADERRLIGLRYVSGFTSVELAESLHLSPEGVRTRLKRIVDRLRKELGDG